MIAPDVAAAARIAVGIVADNEVTSAALARVIADDPELVVVGVASHVRKGRELLRSAVLDVLVVNLALSSDGRRVSGLKFIARAKELRPDLNVLSLKRGVEEGNVRAALDAGADACCLTGGPRERLVRAIKAVSVGGTWLDPEISELIFRSRNPRIEATPRLTGRERAVLQLITEGYSNAAIGAHLHCSSGTVHTHVLNLFEKLGVHDRTSAAVYAIRYGLIFDNVL
jgi:DNA-binding NarL/FixJ family response regulator